MSGHADNLPEHPRGTAFLLTSLGGSFTLEATTERERHSLSCRTPTASLSYELDLDLSNVWFGVVASKYKYGIYLSTQLRFRLYLELQPTAQHSSAIWKFL